MSPPGDRTYCPNAIVDEQVGESIHYLVGYHADRKEFYRKESCYMAKVKPFEPHIETQSALDIYAIRIMRLRAVFDRT